MDLAQSPRPLRICADIPVRGGVEISMPPVFIASENDARHLPRCQLMHRSGRGRDLLAANAQLPAQGNRRVHLLSPYCCGRPSIRPAWLSPPGPWGCCIPASASFRNLDLHDLRDLGMADLDGGGNEPPPKSPAQSFVPRAARALATASYSVPAVTSSACSVWFELWMMTVPLLGVTKEI